MPQLRGRPRTLFLGRHSSRETSPVTRFGGLTVGSYWHPIRLKEENFRTQIETPGDENCAKSGPRRLCLSDSPARGCPRQTKERV